jgi:hypothetical protein
LPGESDASRPSAPAAINRGRRDWSWLNRIVARRTTDLLCIAIVAGGLMTAVSNLWPDSPSGLSGSIDAVSGEVFATDVAIDSESPSAIRWRSVSGDENAAWNALVEELGPVAKSGASAMVPFEEQFTDDLATWPVVTTDTAAKWSIRRPPDMPRMAVAVSEHHGDPLICAWGLIRANGEGSWSVAIVRSP